MSAQRILVTGANGFIGRQIFPHLVDKFELHGTSRYSQSGHGIFWHKSDLRDADAARRLVQNLRPDFLVHAAWNTAHGEFWEAADNLHWLEAGKALFSAFVENGGQRIIGLGSCAEYSGKCSHPRSEGEANIFAVPETLYGRSKLELLQFLESLPVQAAWARIFLVFGPHESERRLIPSIATAMLRSEPVPCSSGNQVRDFLDVRDLGRAIAGLVCSPVTGPINIGSGQQHSIGEVARLLGEIAGSAELIRLGALPDRPGEAPCLVPDTTRQHRELGFIPQISLNHGLLDALRWWSTKI